MILLKNRFIVKLPLCNYVYKRFKHNIDFTKVPILLEKDFEEMHVRGSGPGGQKVNKTSNCVVLKHLPTGIVVKCHETRFLEKNQKRAYEILVTKLDNLINGEDSVEAQIKAIDNKKRISSERKRDKFKALKEEWKRKENS
ncbi:hypothetical protein NQ317_017289 [Molorchus minor]|uniref:Prokaryotic-type class I peptide chain release factors domain-containing protein n=1 Tax=Molorchus minor TaxID=1323400 RepID=A0ABQ9JWC9_9CUCU|nr:hypothetical protein NQ317_017289 [Molorchus minor]